MRSTVRLAVTAVVVAVVASPALRDRDSFPLSTYPVYADVRPRVIELVTAVGLRLDGTERRLSMSVIASTDDPLIAQGRLIDAIRSGTEVALCRRVAGRAPDEVFEVLVVTERHDILRASAGQPSQLDRTIHTRCRTGA